MSGCTKWYHVWRGNRIDEVFETLIRAKKHAAWLHFTCGGKSWFNRVSLTLEGEVIPFDDYEFKNGDSRKVFPANAGGMAQELAAQKHESTNDLNG